MPGAWTRAPSAPLRGVVTAPGQPGRVGDLVADVAGTREQGDAVLHGAGVVGEQFGEPGGRQ
jgi:hypothetical protein